MLVLAPVAAAAERVPFHQSDFETAPPAVLPFGTVDVRTGLAPKQRPRVAFTRPDGRRRVLHQFDRFLAVAGRLESDESFSENVRFSAVASPEWVVASAFRTVDLYDGASETTGIQSTELVVARRKGPARRLDRCRFYLVTPVISGSIVAHNDCGSAAVLIHDLAQPDTTPVRIATDHGTHPVVLAVAGDYVLARLDAGPPPKYGPYPPPGPVVLLERSTGREVARTARSPSQVALREDGTAVLVTAVAGSGTDLYSGCGRSEFELFVLRPGGPERPLGLPACDGPPSIEGDLILYAFPPSERVRTWGLTTLGGGPPRTLGYVLEPTLVGGGLVRLQESTCVGLLTRYRFVTLTDLERIGMPPADTCRFRLRSRIVRVDRRGFARLRYACPAGCNGYVTFPANAMSSGRGEEELRTLPRARATLRFELSPRLRAQVRRRGRVTIDAEISHDIFEPPRTARRTERVTLVRSPDDR